MHCCIYKNNKLTCSNIRLNIAACLRDLQVSYLSLIVLDVQLGTACWSIGEVFYSKPKSKNKNTLNLVDINKFKDEQPLEGIIEDK